MTSNPQATTAAAQRRLLEALSAMRDTPGGLEGLALGFSAGRDHAAREMPSTVAIYEALIDLCVAVREDLDEPPG